jgi:hypothetical protein
MTQSDVGEWAVLTEGAESRGSPSAAITDDWVTGIKVMNPSREALRRQSVQCWGLPSEPFALGAFVFPLPLLSPSIS